MNPARRLFFVWLFVCLPLSAMAQCPDKEIRVGWEPWPPYAMMRDGRLTGLDLDMIRLLLDEMGCSYRFIERPWKRLLLEVEQGKLDLASGASKTAERQQYGLFSHSYRTESAVLLVRRTATVTPLSLDDVVAQQFRLAITRGYYYGDDFDRLNQQPAFRALLQPSKEDRMNLKKLAAGRVDGVLADPFAAAARLREEGLTDQVRVQMTVHANEVYFLLSRQTMSAAFVEQLDQALTKVRADGRYQEIIDQYLN